MTQLGIMIEGQQGLNWGRWQRILQTAEDFGFQCVFRSDHFTDPHPPDQDSLELWTSLTYAAENTRRIEFGPLVAPVTFRHPSMTIRYAAAVDALSGGRLVLGMGAGWQDREHHNYGIPFYDFKTRFEMLTDALQMTRQLFDSNVPVNFKGSHFELHDAILLPRPGRRIPILIGGNSPNRVLPLVAQYADEWNAVFIEQSTYQARTETLNQLLAERGRKPESVKRSLMTQLIFEENESDLQKRIAARGKSADALIAEGLIVGTASAVVDQIGAWAELGVERFMLQWLDQDDIRGLEAVAKDVLPHFHR